MYAISFNMNLTEIVFGLKLAMATGSIIANEKSDSQISKTSEELDCLEENIIVAPLSLAVLGQIMLLSTQCDFSLISKPEKQPLQEAEETTEEVSLLGKREDFQYITHPESFRATLVQVSNSGYHAFLAAHTNMDKTRLACDSTQQHIGLITECIMEGEDDDITTMVPVSLKSMRKTAQECAEWSREIYSKFHHTLKLLEEVHCSCHATQMTNQEKLDKLKRQKEEFAFEKEKAENEKQENQKKIEEIEKKIDEERKEFLKDFQKSQHKITELKKEVITEEDELEQFKQELVKAKNNLDKEYKKWEWYEWVLRRKTGEYILAEDEKSEKDEKVKDKKRVVNTKRVKLKADIEGEKNSINKEEENMKSNEARRIENRNKSMKEMKASANKISDQLSKLNTADLKELDLKDIKKLLKAGIKEVAKLEEHWKQLVQYFEGISNLTTVAMGLAIEDFAGQMEAVKMKGQVAEGSNNSLKIFKKKRLIEFAFSAFSRCNGVSIVSKTYLKISNTYLMPSIRQLGTLVAIDAEREPEKVSSMTKEIQSRSEETIDFVKQVVISAKEANENEVKMKAIEY